MTLSPLARRAERKSRNATMVDMNLVSLIDVFTILIFFLLSNSGVETLPAASVHLPESTAKSDPKQTLVVAVNASEIVVEGRKVADNTRILVVPGSVRVRLQAEEEGLDVIFKEAGAEWRGAGCSMCLGMNPDQLTPGERSASTSNRNFEGRQGKGGRTHLVSPQVAVATGVLGHLASPADLEEASHV